MKYTAFISSTIIATAVLSGCASKPQDIDRMRALVSEAEADSDGACLVALHETAVSLEVARAALAKADEDDLGYEEYQRGMAAAENAVKTKRVVQSNCTLRYAALREESEVMQEKLQATQEALAKLYVRTERLPGVTFTRDSATLTSEAKVILDAVAGRLVEENRKVEIAGHTSNTGSPEHNLTLSQRRAEAVVAHLITRGVKPEKLTAKGYGMTQPVASNDTQAGRNANKRVEIRYLR